MPKNSIKPSMPQLNVVNKMIPITFD